jgi:hypothetical protein
MSHRILQANLLNAIPVIEITLGFGNDGTIDISMFT